MRRMTKKKSRRRISYEMRVVMAAGKQRGSFAVVFATFVVVYMIVDG